MVEGNGGARRANKEPAPGSCNMVEDLLLVAKLTRAYVEIAVRAADLFAGQDELIAALTNQPTLSASDIASQLNIRASTLSKMIDALSAKGLVVRIPNKADHRKTCVLLTPAGLETQALIREIWCAAEENLFGELTPAEATELRHGLELLDSRLREQLALLR
jgi:DNA-binding MarR family transcriptional regulator